MKIEEQTGHSQRHLNLFQGEFYLNNVNFAM